MNTIKAVCFLKLFIIEYIYYGTDFLYIKLREIIRPSKFKSDLTEYIWNNDIKSEYNSSIADVIEDHRNLDLKSESPGYG